MSVEEPLPPTVSGLMGAWPLPDERHWFGIASSSPFVHDGSDPKDTAAVVLLQARVGATQSGLYDEETESQVAAWREVYGGEVEEGVDTILWTQMDETPNIIDE